MHGPSWRRKLASQGECARHCCRVPPSPDPSFRWDDVCYFLMATCAFTQRISSSSWIACSVAIKRSSSEKSLAPRESPSFWAAPLAGPGPGRRRAQALLGHRRQRLRALVARAAGAEHERERRPAGFHSHGSSFQKIGAGPRRPGRHWRDRPAARFRRRRGSWRQSPSGRLARPDTIARSGRIACASGAPRQP